MPRRTTTVVRRNVGRPVGSPVSPWPSGERLAEDVSRLQAALDEAEAASFLPDRATAEPALHDLLVRARLG